MNIRQLRPQLFASVLLCGALMATSCIDNKYDSNEIDMTMGFGTDGLKLPANSSAEIPLADVFELKDGDCVREESNGDYVFYQQAATVTTAHPFINKIVFTDKGSRANDLFLNKVSGSKRHRAAGSFTAKGDVQIIKYEADKPEDVKSLTSASVDGRIHLTVNPTKLNGKVSKFGTVTIWLPEFITLKSVSFPGAQGSWSGNKITFTGVPTNAEFGFDAAVDKFDFTKTNGTYGKAQISGKKIDMDGQIHMEATVNAADIQNVQDLGYVPITTTMDYSDFVITGASGKFTPVIKMNNLGDITVGGVPDFLDDDNIILDIDNPQLLLTVNNDMDVAANVGGTLYAYKDGRQIAAINIDGLYVNGSGETKICLCRQNKDIPAGYTAKVVSNLSDIIRTIPDEIKFSVTTVADGSRESSFLMGHSYNVTPTYEVKAPLAFGQDARIVYKDNFDGWNSSISDMDFSDDSDLGVMLTADVVNRLPVNLTVTASAIDERGNALDNDLDVKVTGVIKASADGSTPVTSPLSIVVSQKTKGAINKLDGVKFTATGEATADGTSVTGVTLNAKKHTLKFDNLKVVVKGKYVGNFN